MSASKSPAATDSVRHAERERRNHAAKPDWTSVSKACASEARTDTAGELSDAMLAQRARTAAATVLLGFVRRDDRPEIWRVLSDDAVVLPGAATTR
jgi:hypothetical protein